MIDFYTLYHIRADIIQNRHEGTVFANHVSQYTGNLWSPSLEYLSNLALAHNDTDGGAARINMSRFLRHGTENYGL